MFGPITIPYGCKMLFNVIEPKSGVTIDDIEMALGEMCNVVKETYGIDTGGFLAGQVFNYAGFISKEGSVGETITDGQKDHLAIITYWNSFEQHEESHADSKFLEYFSNLEELCDNTYELGYELLWQGEREE